eukprot:Pompholyxophrys_punicea_v1_NODE_387_length_2079_cov_25.796937.p2 type:complete len:261 gc:universal NODE_387_length_2079_cov_25.796937:1206-1988(+)
MAKSFLFEEQAISWKYVIAAFYRELERMESNGIGLLPGFDRDVVFKDSWNCMNIHNNKVLLSGHLTAELISHFIANKDWAMTKTIEYLQVLERLFRDIFLDKFRKIYSLDDIAFDSVEESLHWITKWKKNVDQYCEKLNLPEAEKTKFFLAWQTYDLLRIMIFGFKTYCQFFFEKYKHIQPRVFLKPLRMSGSPLELVFCCLKQMKNASGVLNEAKLLDAKASLLIQKMTGDFSRNQYFVREDGVSSSPQASTVTLKRKK